MIQRMINTEKGKELFEGWEETLIWSCLQGVMGEVYADDVRNPASAMAILGDFVFFAGEPDEEMILYKPDWCHNEFIIMVPQNDAWATLIEKHYQEKAKKVSRYAIKKEPDVFDKEKLERIVASLPEEYELRLIDREIYEICQKMEWSRFWVALYRDYEVFQKLGLGVAILKDGELVAGASSYSSYKEGIEIEIDTNEPYRRKGLATVCGARLILECLERNLYPSWDAQNLWSVALAKKLGYHYSHSYTAYEIRGY